MKRGFLVAVGGAAIVSEVVYFLWVSDYTGTSLPGTGTTRTRVKFWFGGPDNSTSLGSKQEIWATLDDVYGAITSDDFDIDCEGSDGGCDGASAYVVGPWGDDINVCDSYFNNGYSISMQAGILIHELSTPTTTPPTTSTMSSTSRPTGRGMR